MEPGGCVSRATPRTVAQSPRMQHKSKTQHARGSTREHQVKHSQTGSGNTTQQRNAPVYRHYHQNVGSYAFISGASPVQKCGCRGMEADTPGVRNSVAVILPDMREHCSRHGMYLDILGQTSCNTFHLHKEQNLARIPARNAQVQTTQTFIYMHAW